MAGAPEAAPIIRIEGLVKRFGELTAVDGVTLDVYPGEVLGILGPNGAGKTTLLEIVEGLQAPTSGRAQVLGHDTHTDVDAVKQRIGVQLQASAYFEFLTLTELLELFATFYSQRTPAAELLEAVGLSDKAAAMIKTLSGGQKQRFTIAVALVNAPEVVFLDESTTGLDPQARRNLWDIIRDIHAQGRTIVLTTHYMEEAEVLCDRVAIIDQGRVIAQDTPKALVRQMPDPYHIRVETSDVLNLGGALDLGAKLEVDGVGLATVEVMDGAYVLRTADALGTVHAVEALAAAQGLTLEYLEVRPATLEDVFLSLTGRSLEP